MSSVKAAERSRAAEEVREAREEYENRANRMSKRQREELKRANEKHVHELNKMQEQYAAQVEDLQERQSEVLSKREAQFKREMDKMKNLYLEQIKRNASDAEHMKGAIRSSYDDQLDRERAIARVQRENMERNFKSEIDEKSKSYDTFASDMRERMSGSIEKQVGKLREKHAEDIKRLEQDRMAKETDRTLEVEQIRNNYRNREAEIARKSANDYKRAQANFQVGLREGQIATEQVLESQREILASERKDMQKRFSNALERELDKFQNAERAIKQQAMDRIDREVRTAKLQKMEAENRRILEAIQEQRARGISEKNIKEQFEGRLKEIELQKNKMRDEILEVANERIAVQNHKNDKILQDTNRRHKLDTNIRAQQARDEYANLELVTANQVHHTNARADERIRKILDVTNEAQKNQQRFHEKSVVEMKNNQADNFAEYQQKQMEQLQQIRLRLEDQLRNQVEKANQKVERVTANYEKEIARIKEDQRDELSRVKAAYEEKLKERDKTLVLERKGLDAQYKSKVAAIEEYHQRDVEAMERRHQEKIANMEARVKALSRRV